MQLCSLLKSATRNLFRKQQVETQLDEEVRAYVDQVTEERIAAGISPSEARRTALAECGGVEQVKQAVRDHRAGIGLELLGEDVHYGLRQFWRNPGFTTTIVVTLALSVGANTAIFSLVNALLLKSLPYARPDRVGSIYTRISGPISTDERHHLDGEQWELLRDNVPALISGLSSMRFSGVNLQAGSQVQYLQAARISAHYLDVLAIHPIIGRNFSTDEDRPHGPNTVILSYGVWQKTFGANNDILGQKAMFHSGAPGLRASALGLITGLILCAGVLRAMHSVLYGIGVYDARTILTVVLMLASVTILATILPTLRIAGIDPASTLREE